MMRVNVKCFLCLSLIPKEEKGDSEKNVKDGKMFTYLFRYLNIDLKLTGLPVSMFEENIKFTCERCGLLMTEFWEWYQNLEAARLCLGSCVQSLHEVIEKSRRDCANPQVKDDPEEFEILERLRTQTITKCRQKLVSEPKVCLNKITIIPVAKLEPDTTATVTENIPAVEGDLEEFLNAIIYPAIPSTNCEKTTSSKSKPFECKFCPKTFSRRDHLRRHTIQLHTFPFFSNHLPRQCTQGHLEDAINITFKNRRRRTIKCIQCEQSLTKKSLRFHLLTRHWSQVRKNLVCFRCPSCPKSFTTKQLLWCHKRVHQIRTGQRSRVQCKFCTLLSTDSSGLRRHMWTCHLMKMIGYKVPQGISEDALKAAIVTASNLPQPHEKNIHWECLYCSKIYGGKEDLKIHLAQVHLDEVLLAFQTNNVTDESDLRREMKLRKKVTFCHRPVVLKSLKHVHKCWHCGVAFQHKSKLAYHLKLDHPKEYFGLPENVNESKLKSEVGSLMKPRTGGKFRCQVCQKLIRYRGDMKVHILQSHLNYVLSQINSKEKESTRNTQTDSHCVNFPVTGKGVVKQDENIPGNAIPKCTGIADVILNDNYFKPNFKFNVGFLH